MNSITEIVNYLKVYMGRPLIAYMVNEPSVNQVTKWSMGTEDPGPEVTMKLSLIYSMFKSLEEYAGSPEVAAQWFIGNNPDLCEMPADTFKTGKYDDVFVAIKSLQ